MNPAEQLKTIRYVRRGAAQAASALVEAADAADPVAALPLLLAAREALDKTIGAAHRYKGAAEGAILTPASEQLVETIRTALERDDPDLNRHAVLPELLSIIDDLTGKNVPTGEPSGG